MNKFFFSLVVAAGCYANAALAAPVCGTHGSKCDSRQFNSCCDANDVCAVPHPGDSAWGVCLSKDMFGSQPAPIRQCKPTNVDENYVCRQGTYGLCADSCGCCTGDVDPCDDRSACVETNAG